MSAMKATTARAIIGEVREIAASQMILIREQAAQIQTLDRRIRSLEEANGLAIDLRDREPRRAVDPDPHLGRF